VANLRHVWQMQGYEIEERAALNTGDIFVFAVKGKRKVLLYVIHTDETERNT